MILLDENGYPPVPRNEVYNKVFEQAENFRKYAEQKMNFRRPNFDFFEMGFKPGEELVAFNHPEIIVTITSVQDKTGTL